MRRDVYDYFQRACRRPLAPWTKPVPSLRDEDVEAAFRVSFNAPGRIEAVEYRCTTCMTLVALCEHVAERLEGATRTEALSLRPEDILAAHPEVPASRHSRAQLAVDAAHAAIRSTL